MKIYIETLGCPKNFNDSEYVAGLLEASGHETVMAGPDNGIADADAVIVNTCGFINDAKKESIDTILEMGRLGKLLIITGCLSQRYGDELFREIPEADIILGVNDYDTLPEILERHKGGHEASEREQHTGMYVKDFEPGCRKLPGNPYTATVKIAEGCNNRCAYCVIPDIRGPYRSRAAEDILQECGKLAAAGCRELVIIAQDITAWGHDTGTYTLPTLLREICRIPGPEWIRLMYCYEDRITDEFIRTMAEEPKICHYIDLPLQHVSDRILKSMGRRSTRKSIENTITRLREGVPDIHIRTTFITGFPGETEDDFQELMEFAGETKFERLGVFAYSREEGTPAAEMPDQTEEKIREERRDAIMRQQLDISLENNMRKTGSIMEVIVDEEDDTSAEEEADEGRVYIGRTRYDAPEIDNSVIIKTEKPGDTGLKPGDIIKVRITDAFDYDLAGVQVK